MAYYCVECSKLFVSNSSLNRHIKSVHLKERNFQCEYCNKTFGRQDNLNTHIKTIHLKERNFPCEYCSKTFGRQGHLETHIKTIHLKERNFQCEHCNKTFGQHCSLKTHIELIHTNPKPKSMSRLEQKVDEILNKYNISHIREFTFKDLVGLNNGYLRYDFCIETSNDSIPYILIEVDGSQHEKPVNFGNISDDQAIKNFENLQEHDRLKDLYAAENDYPLLRIKFEQYKCFEELIVQFLTQYIKF